MCSILALGSTLKNQIFQVILFKCDLQVLLFSWLTWSGPARLLSRRGSLCEMGLGCWDKASWDLGSGRSSMKRSIIHQTVRHAWKTSRGEKTCEWALEIEEESFGNVSFLSPGHQPHRHGATEAAWVCVWRACVSRCPGSEGRWSCRTKTHHFRHLIYHPPSLLLMGQEFSRLMLEWWLRLSSPEQGINVKGSINKSIIYGKNARFVYVTWQITAHNRNVV